MPRKTPPELEFRWRDGSLRAAGLPAVIVVAIIATAWLVLSNWEKLLG